MKVRGYRIEKTQGSYVLHAMIGPWYCPNARVKHLGCYATGMEARAAMLKHAQQITRWYFDKNGSPLYL